VCVSIAKLINFCIFGVVTISDIHITMECCCAMRARRFSGALFIISKRNPILWKEFPHRKYRGYIYLLYTALRLDLGVDMRNCFSCSMSVSKIREGSRGTEWTMGLHAVAAGLGVGCFAALTWWSAVDELADWDSDFTGDCLDGRRIGDENWESRGGGLPGGRHWNC